MQESDVVGLLCFCVVDSRFTTNNSVEDFTAYSEEVEFGFVEFYT